jgi:hypothetical protein
VVLSNQEGLKRTYESSQIYEDAVPRDLEDIQYDDIVQADKVIVSTIVGDFKIMDNADVADVSPTVGVKDVTSKLNFKMNFSGHKGCMLACKTPSLVALEEIAKSRCFLVGLATGDK